MYNVIYAFSMDFANVQWPAEGRIEVQDLEVRYAAELDPVLHKISFDVRSQEKLGVVGR